MSQPTATMSVIANYRDEKSMIELAWAYGHAESADSAVLLHQHELADHDGTILSAILDATTASDDDPTMSEDQLLALLEHSGVDAVKAELDGIGGLSGPKWFTFLCVATFHGGLVARAHRVPSLDVVHG